MLLVWSYPGTAGFCSGTLRGTVPGHKFKASSCLLSISWSIWLQTLIVRLRAIGRAQGQAPSADAPLTRTTREMDPFIFQRFQLILAYAHLVGFFMMTRLISLVPEVQAMPDHTEDANPQPAVPLKIHY